MSGFIIFPTMYSESFTYFMLNSTTQFETATLQMLNGHVAFL